MITVTAPVRIDISAGWSDADPFRGDFGGAVLNAAINLRVKASLNHKRLVSSLQKVPSSSGLGTSGALRTVYLVAANPSLITDKKELIKRVHVFENAIVGQRAGFQDQAAAIYGGVNYWEFRKNGFIEMKRIPKNDAWHLYDRLILLYTGSRHLSADVHEKVFQPKRYVRCIPSIKKMKKIASDMSKYLGNERKMAALLNETWNLQKSLYTNVETKAMKEIQNVCKDCYLAARATGAGGGGCMLFYARPEQKRSLTIKINRMKKRYRDLKILKFDFDYRGIELSQ